MIFKKKLRFSSVLVKYNFFYKVILLFIFFPVEDILSNIQHFQGQNIYFLNVSGPPSSESGDCPLIQGNIIIGKSISNKILERAIFFLSSIILLHLQLLYCLLRSSSHNPAMTSSNFLTVTSPISAPSCVTFCCAYCILLGGI